MPNPHRREQHEEDIDTLHYDTWVTRDGLTTGYIAIYSDPTGTWMKIVHNGVVKCYERIQR